MGLREEAASLWRSMTEDLASLKVKDKINSQTLNDLKEEIERVNEELREIKGMLSSCDPRTFAAKELSRDDVQTLLEISKLETPSRMRRFFKEVEESNFIAVNKFFTYIHIGGWVIGWWTIFLLVVGNMIVEWFIKTSFFD